MLENDHQLVYQAVQKLSSSLDEKKEDIVIILAAGHGKRIKSEVPKMLHQIWGVPSVVRVSKTVEQGLKGANQLIVIGIKGHLVASAIGKKPGIKFVWQEEQKGTGHAVQVALKSLPDHFKGKIYILPGDMGLISVSSLEKLKAHFEKSNHHLLLLTAIFEGKPEENYYGRVVRVPKVDQQGNSTNDLAGQVMGIVEYKDILALEGDCQFEFKGKKFTFSKEELLAIKEFNSGVYAFRAEPLQKYISQIKPDNIQGEYYLTSLVSIFSSAGLSVGAIPARHITEVIAFNTKEILKKMEEIACQRAYDKLKNIISFEAPDNFFIADEVIEEILKMEKQIPHLEISIGQGVQIHPGVKLNKGVQIGKNSFLKGNIILGENVIIGENVTLSTYPNQKLVIEKGSKIFQGNIIKGEVRIGKNCYIESSVIITGSDEYPVKIGRDTVIKGTTYIFGSVIEDSLLVHHSVLIKKYVEKVVKKDGRIQPIRFYLPPVEGVDSIRNLAPDE